MGVVAKLFVKTKTDEENCEATMKDQTLGAPCYKTMGHAADTAKIEWVISHFEGNCARRGPN